MDGFREFLQWEQASRDTIDVKRVYIDVVDDLVAGILLSQIVFWYLPGKNGNKLRIEKDGKTWIAKGRNDWWDECRITPKQFDRAISLLEEKNIVEKELFKFNGSPTVHIALNTEILLEGVKSILTKGENPISPKGKIHFNQRVKSITEITTETTTEIKRDLCTTLTKKQLEQVIEEWNKLGLQQLKRINPNTTRHKMLKARINEYSFDEILQAIKKVNESDFLKGQNKSGWTIFFDWLIKPNNFIKVLEGNYSKGGDGDKEPESKYPIRNMYEDL